MKPVQVKLTEGRVWRITRDARHPAGWVLETHDGCKRIVGENWLTAVYRVKGIAENYGLSIVSELS
jgi:hypothetical protein